MPRAKPQAATVWIYTADARRSGDDIETAWSQRCMNQKHVGSFNPVEIRIRLSDIPRAVAKWERVANLTGVCKVVISDKPAYERYNKVFV